MFLKSSLYLLQKGCLDLSKNKLAVEDMVVQSEIEYQTDNQGEEQSGALADSALPGDQEQADVSQENPEESQTEQDLEPNEIRISVKKDLLIPRTTELEEELAVLGMVIHQHKTPSENETHEQIQTVVLEECALPECQVQADLPQENPEESLTDQDLEPNVIKITVKEDLLMPRPIVTEPEEEYVLAAEGIVIHEGDTNFENEDLEQLQTGVLEVSALPGDLETKKISISKKELRKWIPKPIKTEPEEDILDQAVVEGFKKPMPIDCSKAKKWKLKEIPRDAPNLTDQARPSTSKETYQENTIGTCDTTTARLKKVYTRKEYEKLKTHKKKGKWTEELKAEESPSKKKQKHDTVAVIANGGLEYLTIEHARIIKYMLIEAINEHLNQEIERNVDPWERKYLRFQTSAWVNPGYFVVKCEDYYTYKWICNWNPGILDNLKLKVIPYEWIQWPIKIGFFLNTEERPDPVEVKTQIWRQNGVETYHWKVDFMQRKQDVGEPIGWYLTFWVPTTAYKGLKLREWKLWYKLLKTKVEIVQFSNNGDTDPLEMALKAEDESQ